MLFKNDNQQYQESKVNDMKYSGDIDHKYDLALLALIYLLYYNLL